MKQGAFTFVLHSHLPYCRQAGRWPHGEEWIHEAASETYVPLLRALWDLRDEGVPFKSTIGVTPVLAEQLNDPLVNEHFVEYVTSRQRAAEADLERHRTAGAKQLVEVADFYREFYRGILSTYTERFGSDLIGAFRSLQDSGHIEIATSAATHGYLPLLDRDSSIEAQIGIGVHNYERLFNRRPTAIWLPECAYRPGYVATENGRTYEKPGIEQFLAAHGLKVFFSETHTIEGGRPVGKAAGDAVGPYGDIPRRYLVPLPEYREPTNRTTYEPYWVSGVDVAVIGRNNRTGMQVWSADNGYPGDFWYREFHKKDGASGLQYWRITGARVDLADKGEYRPEQARAQVYQHARHFASLVEELITNYHAQTGRYGIISSAYDTELFGHWWFEGVEWIREVLRLLAASDIVDLTTATEFIEQHPPEDVLVLPESSWGQGGTHFTWMNVDTEWMWPIIHGSERRMEQLVATYGEAQGPTRDVLQQAGRELLLLQSSDWPFLVSTGQAREYAVTRFEQHVDRFDQLARILESGPAGPNARALAEDLYDRDKVFPDVDYQRFRNREGEPLSTMSSR